MDYNKRNDDFGGTLEKRAEFVRRIMEGIRAEVGRDYPVIIRLTADEYMREIGKEGGITLP